MPPRRQFVDRAISGFTDRTGCRWCLSSYVDMATHTAVQAKTDRLHAAGMSLIYVSNALRATAPLQAVQAVIAEDRPSARMILDFGCGTPGTSPAEHLSFAVAPRRGEPLLVSPLDLRGELEEKPLRSRKG